MANKNIIPAVIAEAPNRRSFVRKLGIASAAASAAFVFKPGEADAASSHPNDVDILNFALNLEYLEAEFYTVATTGKDIEDIGIGTSGNGKRGPTYGGHKVTFSNKITEAVAAEIAFDEQAHVKLLRAALDGAAIAKPEINLDALGFGFGSQQAFLTLARIFEDIGVTAYGGAAPLISSKAILATAARILATEAEHVGNIRLQVAQMDISTSPPLDSVDVLPPPCGTKYFSVNNEGLTAVRTPGQVLFLAFGGKGNATSGGFFPDGVNGYFRESSSKPA